MTNTVAAPARVNVARGLVLALIVVSLVVALAGSFFSPSLTVTAPAEDKYDIVYDCLMDLGYRGVWDGEEQLVGVTPFDRWYCGFMG